MPSLFPPIQPYKTGQLAVDGMHTLYFEEAGNPNGTPVIFLHGGPGVGLHPVYRRFFDPAAWRIILLDQRGSGKSTPLAETQGNTPAHLVSDLEHLRMHLGIERWHVFGGSWGSTLALIYAVAYPERIISMTLRSIFMLRQQEIDWYMHGIRHIRPEAWEYFTEIVPPERHGDLLQAYVDMLEDPNPSVHMEAAKRWCAYETYCADLVPPAGPQAIAINKDTALSMARLEATYFLRHRFSPDDFILREVDRYRHIPTTIVHGQYDLICPIVSAWELHRAWNEAEFVVVPDAGHSLMEPGITAALIEATERYKHMR